MFAPSLAARSAALASLAAYAVALAAGAGALAAGALAAVAGATAVPEVAPAVLDFYALGTPSARRIDASQIRYRGAYTVATSNPAVAIAVAAGADPRRPSHASIVVTPLGAGSAQVILRGRAGPAVIAIVHVAAVTLVLHDVPAATRSVRIETARYADGVTSASTLDVTPTVSKTCARETGGTRCAVTAGAVPGAARLRVSFFDAPSSRGRLLAETEHVATLAADGNTRLGISNATFLNYFPVRVTPEGSLADRSSDDAHVWFTASSPEGRGIVRATTTGSIQFYRQPQLRGSISLAGGNGLVLFALASTSAPPGFSLGYVGSITPTGYTSLVPTPADATCSGFVLAPVSITLGPDGNPWFLETLCRNAGVGTVAGRSQTSYPMPLDILSKPLYSLGPYQHGIVGGADGALWFFANLCGLRASACAPDLPSRGAIGRVTPHGAMQFYALPQTNGACPGGFVARGGDGNIWFAQPCPPAGAPPYIETTIGRIDPSGLITEYPGLGSVASDIAEGPDGDVYLATQRGVARVVTRGTRTGHIDEYLSTRVPGRIGSVGAGPDGKLYAIDAIGRYDRIALPANPDR